MQENSENQWMWDRYWHGDRLACCFDSPSGNYSAELLDLWVEFFASVPKNSKLLDLCTGNGAIALTAANVSNENHLAFDITAIDLAQIDPKKYLNGHEDQLGKIRFIGGQSVEQMAFDDESFDIVTSQYGIEYSDLAKTLSEINRVLKPKGQLRLIFHAGEGSVSKSTKLEMDECEQLLTSGLFNQATNCVTALWVKDPLPPVPTEAARHRFQTEMQQLHAILAPLNQKLTSLSNPDLYRSTLSVVNAICLNQARLEGTTLLSQLATVEIEIKAHLARMQQLFNAAQSENQVKQTGAYFERSGFTDIHYSKVELSQPKRQVGWLFSASKN